MDPEAGVGRRHLHAVDELDPRPRVLGEKKVAVEVDVVAERRDAAPGRDREARLDHAAEHDPEPESPGSVGHANGFADPPRLRELQVDAVCALAAGGYVAERVAILVDVDRER